MITPPQRICVFLCHPPGRLHAAGFEPTNHKGPDLESGVVDRLNDRLVGEIVERDLGDILRLEGDEVGMPLQAGLV